MLEMRRSLVLQYAAKDMTQQEIVLTIGSVAM
jgi:hypothetical protein